jgi:hypothetical protein
MQGVSGIGADHQSRFDRHIVQKRFAGKLGRGRSVGSK